MKSCVLGACLWTDCQRRGSCSAFSVLNCAVDWPCQYAQPDPPFSKIPCGRHGPATLSLRDHCALLAMAAVPLLPPPLERDSLFNLFLYLQPPSEPLPKTPTMTATMIMPMHAPIISCSRCRLPMEHVSSTASIS